MTELRVHIRVREGAKAPEYRSNLASGADLRARLDTPLVIAPGGRVAVPTGISIAVPEGYEAQVRPRSGLALREGLSCINSPGTIDADYRGEILVLLVNLGQAEVIIRDGDRIAQLVIAPVARAVFEEVSELDSTERGEGGFGSTGKT
ncbi:MAG TPA: dUTP diphosphatase [Rectinemataceae bacterium]|nr:dUTP diphosphatase [Rectinemataceae bacterium]